MRDGTASPPEGAGDGSSAREPDAPGPVEGAPPAIVPTAEERRLYPEAGRFYIPSLDGIRAVAFLLVFLNHTGWPMFPAAFGVTLFFFLSGYLITTLLRREAERTGTIDLGAFYLRRVLRILPPFYLVLTVAFAAKAWFAPGELTWQAVLIQYCHLTNYYDALGVTGILLGTGVAWSLAVEEHFYLLFPLIYIGLTRRLRPRGQATCLLALCGLVLGWRCVLVYGLGVGRHYIYNASDTRADAILFGCILAVVGNPMMDRAGPTRRRVDVALVPVALLAIAASWVVPDRRFYETFRYTIQSLAMIPLFTAAIRYPDWPPFRLLNCRPARFLGVLSYSLYLIHLNIVEWLGPTGITRVPLTLVTLAASLALAYAVYLGVELPCARLRRRLDRAPKDRDGQRGPAAGGDAPSRRAGELARIGE